MIPRCRRGGFSVIHQGGGARRDWNTRACSCKAGRYIHGTRRGDDQTRRKTCQQRLQPIHPRLEFVVLSSTDVLVAKRQSVIQNNERIKMARRTRKLHTLARSHATDTSAGRRGEYKVRT